MSKTRYSKTAVTEIIKKFRETGSLEDRKKSGRPPKLTKDDNKYLKTLSLRNRKKTSTKLAKDINTATGKNVSSPCIRRHLLKSELRGCVAIRKPLLRRGNKEKQNNTKIGPRKCLIWFCTPMSPNSKFLEQKDAIMFDEEFEKPISPSNKTLLLNTEEALYKFGAVYLHLE